MLRVPGEVVSHTADVPIPWLPREMEYPPVVLRHYEGEVNFAGQMLFFTRTAILPDSFKWWLTPNPKNPRARSVSPYFARIPHANIPARTLTGTYFQLDCTGPGHFGHIMTEGISKLWAWDEAKRQIPDLKALYFRRRVKSPADSIEHRLFRQYGICDEDIVAVGEPVRVTSLLSATPMWHNAEPHSVNPEFRAVWDRLAGIAATNVPTYDRIFVSRTDKWWRRSCRNTADVEDLFRAHGFEIVYPEMLDLSVQAAIFRDARVVAGFGGSAMFNVMYARRLETMILLNHEAYTARNEHLYSALLGCDIHYFWSAPDIPHPTHGWSQDAFDSGWEFDFGRNRDDLNQLLKGIS
jgi:capsular polysaccharide biosynthesis protein